MADRPGAVVGYAFAWIALVTSVVSWSQGAIPAALATVVLLSFVFMRYDLLKPASGAVIATIFSVGITAVAIDRIFSTEPRLGLVITAIAGGACIGAAYLDWRDVGQSVVPGALEVISRAFDIGVLGILAILVWSTVAFGVVQIVSPGGASTRLTTVLSTLASGAGTLTVVALYLRYSDRDVSFLDLRRPGLRGLAYVVGGTVAVLGGNLAIGFAFRRFGVDAASHTVVQTAEADPTVLLVLVPLSFLVIAPGEELLYRNVVQKSLREQFSPVAGVVVASVVFAAVHLPAYSSPDATLQATLSTLAVIFVLALVLGSVYELTRNVVVPILVHGTFNAVAFAVTYAQFTGLFAG